MKTKFLSPKIDSNIYVEEALKNKYSTIMKEQKELFLRTTFKENYQLPIHNWYKYTQAFSPNLVLYLIKILKIQNKDFVLDPFAGVGTTPLTCQEVGIPCKGFEVSPIISFIANAKLYRNYKISDIIKYKNQLASVEKDFGKSKLKIDSSIKIERFLPEKSAKYISGVLEWLSDKNPEIKQFFLIALLSTFEEMSYIRKHGSHYRFMNESNIGVNKKIDFQKVVPSKLFHAKLHRMIEDLEKDGNKTDVRNSVINSSIFDLLNTKENGFTHVITSPPYLNRNNYIAQQKIELFIFNIISSFEEYRNLTRNTLRSHVEATKQHTCNYSNEWIDSILESVKDEELSYPTVPGMIKGYFEDIFTTLKLLQKNSAQKCTYSFVVGNSRWSGVVVPVDTILLTIAEDLGMEAKQVSVTRYKGNSPQQMKKYGKYPVRESIVIFSDSK